VLNGGDGMKEWLADHAHRVLIASVVTLGIGWALFCHFTELNPDWMFLGAGVLGLAGGYARHRMIERSSSNG
jgi:hypothetical protein